MASILKSIVLGIPALIVLNPVSKLLGFTTGFVGLCLGNGSQCHTTPPFTHCRIRHHHVDIHNLGGRGGKRREVH